MWNVKKYASGKPKMKAMIAAIKDRLKVFRRSVPVCDDVKKEM
jgi:hypothetical protein